MASAVHTAFVRPWRARWMNYVDVGILGYMVLILHTSVAWIRKDETSDHVLSALLGFGAVIGALGGFVQGFRLCCSIACGGSAKRTQMRATLREQQETVGRELYTQTRSREDLSNALDELYMEEQELRQNSSAHRDPHYAPPVLLWISQQASRLNEVVSIARHMRHKDYSLQCFYEDCLSAFPELQLYISVDGQGGRLATELDQQSPAHAMCLDIRGQEQQRTMGALFAVYWVCRLDIDGKRGLSFGVEESNPHKVHDLPKDMTQRSLQGIPWAQMSTEQRKAHFYWNFDWALLADLFQRAGITQEDMTVEAASEGASMRSVVSVDANAEGRLVAMLSLTAFHDIMKNQALCPTVRGESYSGFKPGETILDHDLALAYVLDRYPDALPSFAILTPEQRRVVRFTQSEMGFNAGWLVQAEGPPSAVLSKLKKAIANGKAHEADVAFYFAHWVTDLAGAEPTPFRGSEKFAVKFPPAVLQSLMGCFSVVQSLANATETEVYETYLANRWEQAGDSLGFVPEGQDRMAKLRLHCMAQHNCKPVLEAFDQLRDIDRDVLIEELSATGLESQNFSSFDSSVGTPFLMYYGPAWFQRVGAEHPLFALQVLASIYRASRVAFPQGSLPEDLQSSEGFRTVMLSELRTIEIKLFEAIFYQSGGLCLQVIPNNNREGTLMPNAHLLSL
mmetsp:Transcript_45207/g.107596  ORF Transcript_45207/g.107596 Transcript_45207/m.107596 type:complete len:679 (-) Transcript_45207:53-2089(-)